VIHKSDVLILALASCALAVGVFRWHQNTHTVNAVTIPASSNIGESALIPLPAVTTGAVPVVSDEGATTTDSVTITSEATEAIEVNPYLEYTVRAGDYLSKIAVEYDTNVRTLRELNNLSSTTIRVGQTLLYPNPAAN